MGRKAHFLPSGQNPWYAGPMARMIGRINKPFCGNCCSETPQGSGKVHKRRGTKVQKSRERRWWQQEIEQEEADE